MLLVFSSTVFTITAQYKLGLFLSSFGSVPEIAPVEEFNVTPEGNAEPLANAYVTVESESVAVAETDIETFSLNVPSDPLAVCQTGDALT